MDENICRKKDCDNQVTMAVKRCYVDDLYATKMCLTEGCVYLRSLYGPFCGQCSRELYGTVGKKENDDKVYAKFLEDKLITYRKKYRERIQAIFNNVKSILNDIDLDDFDSEDELLDDDLAIG